MASARSRALEIRYKLNAGTPASRITFNLEATVEDSIFELMPPAEDSK